MRGMSDTQTEHANMQDMRRCSKCDAFVFDCECYEIRDDIEERRSHWQNVKSIITTYKHQPMVPLNRKTINGGRRQ